MPGRMIGTIGVIGLLATHLFGQQAGQIVGVVTDASGALVSGAKVRAIEVGTGFAREAVANAEGQYVLTTLRPTQYEMTAEAAGFRTFRRSGVELLANQSLTINIALEVGAVTETVNVAGGAVQAAALTVSAHTNRVPTEHGHLVCLSLGFERRVSPDVLRGG